MGVSTDYQLRYHEGLPEALAAEGWTVHVVASPGPNLNKLRSVSGVVAHEIPVRRAPSALSDIVALMRWWSLLLRLRPAVTVVGTPKAGLLGNVAARLTGVPYRVYELHGLRLEGESGLKRRFLALIERISCLCASDVVPVGASLASACVRAGLVPARKVCVLGGGSSNGVDIAHFEAARNNAPGRGATRAAHGIGGDCFVLTFIGRINEDKGIRVLADAFLDLVQCENIHLLVVGECEDEAARAVTAELSAVAPSSVSFVGPVDDVAPYLAATDVLCLPSRREGLPTVVLEAFACGVPVVASPATGTVDLVRDGETGFLFRSGSAGDLTRVVRLLLTGTINPDQIVAEARRRVYQQYQRQAVQCRWVTYLNDLVRE